MPFPVCARLPFRCAAMSTGPKMMVQEALLRALANINSFQPGTNMSAWLFTILRNLFRSEYRKRRREVEDADGRYAESLIPSRAARPGRV